jgi:hypothetical protein
MEIMAPVDKVFINVRRSIGSSIASRLSGENNETHVRFEPYFYPNITRFLLQKWDAGKCGENDVATGVLSRWRFCGKLLGFSFDPGDLTLERAFLSIRDKQAEACYFGSVHRGNRRKLDAVMSRGKVCKGQSDLLPCVFFCGEGGLVANAVEKDICS